MSKQNTSIKDVAAKFYEPFNCKDVALFEQVLHPDWLIHPEIPGQGSAQELYFPRAIGLLQSVPDVEMKIEKQIAEDDLVAVRITISGTHQGEFLGIPATGKYFSIGAHDIHRIADGRIVESWHVEDWLSALVQLGAFGS